MSHATLVNDGLFWFVIFLTLLLMMFIYAVIVTPPEDAVRTGPPTLNAPAPPPPAPAGRPQASTSPAGCGCRKLCHLMRPGHIRGSGRRAVLGAGRGQP